jgi:sulfur carrier protein ThiS
MILTFKLYASLSEYLPPGSHNQQIKVDVAEDTTPVMLLERYGVPLTEVHLVLVNGVFVPPSERNTPLSEGDQLAVWPAVAGG